jgi:hypothetical protein
MSDELTSAHSTSLPPPSPYIFPTPPPAVHTHRWTLAHGTVVVQYPKVFSEEEYAEVCDLLDLIQRAMKRAVTPSDKTPGPAKG